VGLRTGLGDMVMRIYLLIPELELRPLGLPAGSHRYTECVDSTYDMYVYVYTTVFIIWNYEFYRQTDFTSLLFSE
jgi:hypothetical protein